MPTAQATSSALFVHRAQNDMALSLHLQVAHMVPARASDIWSMLLVNSIHLFCTTTRENRSNSLILEISKQWSEFHLPLSYSDKTEPEPKLFYIDSQVDRKSNA